jgi:hypothetical protein
MRINEYSSKMPPATGTILSWRTTRNHPAKAWRMAVRTTMFLAAAMLAHTLCASAKPGKIPPEKLEGKSSVVIIPGEGYRKGTPRSLAFGSNWRELWTTPIELPILDLGSFAGGMTPLDKDGDQLSATLLFRGANGKEYSFLTLDKDPARRLSPIIRGTALETYIQDGVSSLNPVAALILDPLLDAAGVCHLSHRLFVMPYDHARLGEWFNEFAGLPGMVEDYPSGSDAGGAGFMGARTISGTYELLFSLDRDNRNVVDARTFLKARLMDMLVGDGDRQSDQWNWAGYSDNGRTLWIPLPIRQYQAFSRQTGFAKAGPGMLNFGASYPQIRQLVSSGSFLDRRLLSGIDRKEWNEVTADLVRKLTDRVIAEAVRNMPPPMYAKEGKRLERDLIARRDRLGEVSAELYRLYAGEVDIHGSDMSEYVETHRFPGGELEVSMSRRDDGPGMQGGDAFYRRLFLPDETREVRLFLHEGNNVAVIDGPVGKKSITARFIGGKGKNRLEDRTDDSTDKQHPQGRRTTFFYDHGHDTEIVAGKHTVVDRYRAGDREEQIDERARYDLKPRDTGSKVVTGLSSMKVDFSPDYGALVGWGATIEDYGFNYDPYRYHAQLDGAAAFGEDFRFSLSFVGDLRTVFRNASLHLETVFNTLDNINFYGLGNESNAGKTALNITEFETHSNVARLKAALRYPPRFEKEYYWEGGIETTRIETEPETGSFLELHRKEIPGVDVDFTNCLQIGFHFDSRSSGEFLDLSPRAPSEQLADKRLTPNTTALRGMTFDIEGKYFPELIGNRSSFGKLSGEFRTYVPLNDSHYSRVVFRLGGQKNWGGYPYFEAATIGGSNSIRGYDRNRFAGDASVYANTEFRLYGGRTTIFVPILFGPLLFADTGRVFVDGESSGQWHTGVGGGLWVAFFEPRYSAHIALARGLDDGRLNGDYAVYAKVGFGF